MYLSRCWTTSEVGLNFWRTPVSTWCRRVCAVDIARVTVLPVVFGVIFSDEDMDGKAIAAGLATCPGPDWLKDVVTKVGLRLKVHTALRTFYNNSQVCTRYYILFHT